MEGARGRLPPTSMTFSCSDDTMAIDGQAVSETTPVIQRHITEVIIRNCAISRLLLPPQVKTLRLVLVHVSGSIVMSSALEELTIVCVTTERPVTEWVFFKPLKRMIVKDSDLPRVDCAVIELQSFSRGTRGPSLPESLEELIIDGCHCMGGLSLGLPAEDTSLPDDTYCYVTLPPNLRVLSLNHVSNLITMDHPTLAQIEELTMNHVFECSSLDLITLFPAVVKLRIEDVFFRQDLSLKLPHLRELIINRCRARKIMKIDTIGLEHLTIDNSAFESILVSTMETGAIGQSLKSLTLTRVDSFPEAEEWERLEAVAITKSKVEVPFIRWLSELTLDEAIITTNGGLVESIDQYRYAWNLKSAKSARM